MLLKKKPLRVNAGPHQAHLICVTVPLSTSAIMVSNERAGQLDRKKMGKKLCQHLYKAVTAALFMTDKEGIWD